MFLSNDKVSFRQIEREDLPMLRDWRNSPIIRSRVREFKPLNMVDQEYWFNSYNSNNIMFGIEIRPQVIQLYPDCPETIKITQPRLIGVCGLTHIDWKNRSAELSCYIDDDFRDRGLERYIMALLCSYAFDEIGLHRFWCEVYILDDTKMSKYHSLGFETDGTIRDTYWWDGRWYSSAFVSMLDNEWKEMRNSYVPR